MLYKSVMLFGGSLRQRLEPMGIVGDPILVGPLLHALGHSIGDATIQTGAILYHVHHLLVHVSGKILIHFLLVEHVLAKQLRRTLLWRVHYLRLLVGSLGHSFKSQVGHTLWSLIFRFGCKITQFERKRE